MASRLLGPGRAGQGLHREANGGEGVLHLVRHPARHLTEGTDPFGLELAGAAEFELSGHGAECGSKRLEFRCAAERFRVGNRLVPGDVPGPADQLVDRPAQLPGEMPAQPDGGVDVEGAERQEERRQPGVVVLAIRLGGLGAHQGTVQGFGVGGERAALGTAEPGGVDRFHQHTARVADPLHRGPGGGGRVVGADGEGPAEDGDGGGDGAQRDQHQQDALAEGEGEAGTGLGRHLIKVAPGSSPRRKPGSMLWLPRCPAGAAYGLPIRCTPHPPLTCPRA